MRKPLTAKKSFIYAGKALKAGDAFSAPRGDARALVALGRAVVVDSYQTTRATADVSKEPVASAPAKAVEAVEKKRPGRPKKAKAGE